MSKPNIAIALPSVSEEEWLAVKEPILSGWLTQGRQVAEFEASFANLHQVPHAKAVTSCTAALHLALLALDIKPGDEVLVPAFSWVASANAVLYCGATPILVDVDATTFNIDPNKIKEKLTERTRAIVVVHLFGLCADMDEIKSVLPESVAIVEDAACAAGASYKNKFAGALGDIAAFSFHPRKIITTGEGGMVTTCDPELADKVDKLRNHGASISEEQRHHGPRPYIMADFNMVGYNYRMTDLQGAVGKCQLQKLKELVAQRRALVRIYEDKLANVDWFGLPQVSGEYGHNWQSYVLMIDAASAPIARNQLMAQLQENGVSTRPGTHAIHTLNAYKELYGFKEHDFPVAALCQQQSMAIPLHNQMTQEDVHYVCEQLLSI